MTRTILGLPENFWARTSIQDMGYETPCVIWTASKTKHGYGNLKLRSKNCFAHRLAYEALCAPIPARTADGDRAVIDHLCRNRACLNVAHLELVSNWVNILRAPTSRTECLAGHVFGPENPRQKDKRHPCLICLDIPRSYKPRALKTHCKRGHELVDGNLYIRANGKRECLACTQARSDARVR